MAGGEYIGFNNAVFQSERATADRNFALGYYMRENNCFPKTADLQESLDLYFQVRLGLNQLGTCLYTTPNPYSLMNPCYVYTHHIYLSFQYICQNKEN